VIVKQSKILHHSAYSLHAFACCLPILAHLAVFGNSLSSIIPPHVGRLVSLRVLDLGSNDFSGAIPTEIGLLLDLGEYFVNTKHEDLV
jgi:hypothetical protein